jgi:hypothetical protein
MANDWDYLPNAKHIDFVLEHVKHLDAWASLRWVIGTAAWSAAWNATKSVTGNKVSHAVWDSLQDAVWNATWHLSDGARDVLWDALGALIAFDDCAHLLYSDPKEVEILAKLGVHAAVLLFPATVVINACNTKQSVV